MSRSCSLLTFVFFTALPLSALSHLFLESFFRSLIYRNKPGQIWVFPKKGVYTPKWMVYKWKTLLKWMIWGYHYFWKHAFEKREESHLTRVTNVLIHVSRFIPNLPEIHISNCFGENVGFTAWIRDEFYISSGVWYMGCMLVSKFHSKTRHIPEGNYMRPRNKLVKKDHPRAMEIWHVFVSGNYILKCA